MGHHIINEVSQEKFEFTGRAKMIAIALFVIGAILAGVGAMNVKKNWGNHGEQIEAHEEHETDAHGDHHATLAQDDAHEGAAQAAHGEAAHGEHEVTYMSRVWANLLMNSYYFWLFAISAVFFIAVNYVANAGWAVMLKRVMEAQSSYIYIGSAILVAVLIGAKDTLYHWVQYIHSSAAGNPADAGYDAILESKRWLLNESSLFFFIPFVLIVWVLIRRKLRKNSTAEDETKDLGLFKSSTRWSAGFIFFFAFSFSALSWLIIMSIDAHWYSTMFSVYNFAISFVTGLSVMMVIAQYLKSKGYMEMVSDEVIHDLGKFMFAFCVFWGYIFLGQWLLIWYTNLPEETVYFAARLQGQYKTLFAVNIFMCFLAPFLVLMMRNAKRSPKVLLTAAAIILIGHWVDVYLLIMPGTIGDHAGIGMLEVGTTMAFAGLFIYVVLNSLSKANMYPTNHPYLLESANHDVGP
ncbi:quinol:cytochrome C oxidoreductase [Bacteroidia bacterium]|nr:quinol:cytochrome C oxidoreductase [Bacteroidia bacterium]